MRTTCLLIAGALALAPNGAVGDSFTGSDYPAHALLSICQLADNDSREVGKAAEIECEQYILGFVDALMEVGAVGSESGLCPPDTNTADEVRWAYTKWVHGSYTERSAMPAADALLETLKDSFDCE